jgi:hypothetical protein
MFMSKTSIVIIAIIAVLALGLGLASFLMGLQRQNLTANSFGMMFQSGRQNQVGDYSFGMGPGMMGGFRNNRDGNNQGGNNDRDLQSYMLTAVAGQLGMSESDLNTQLQNGKSLLDLAADKDMTVSEYKSMLETARTSAIEQALADGVITKTQADNLKSNSQGLRMGGFGLGACW